MKEVIAVIRMNKMNATKNALTEAGISAFFAHECFGRGKGLVEPTAVDGVKKGMEEAGPILLEPIMKMTIIVPEQFMGDVLGDLNTRRARVQGMSQEKGVGVITALVPLAEIQRYATDLRSFTQGRGFFTMKLSHYEPVPAHLMANIISAAKREAEREKE